MRSGISGPLIELDARDLAGGGRSELHSEAEGLVRVSGLKHRRHCRVIEQSARADSVRGGGLRRREAPGASARQWVAEGVRRGERDRVLDEAIEGRGRRERRVLGRRVVGGGAGDLHIDRIDHREGYGVRRDGLRQVGADDAVGRNARRSGERPLAGRRERGVVHRCEDRVDEVVGAVPGVRGKSRTGREASHDSVEASRRGTEPTSDRERTSAVPAVSPVVGRRGIMPHGGRIRDHVAAARGHRDRG